MGQDLRQRLESALGTRVQSLQPLSGGDVAAVYVARLSDGRLVVVKADHSADARHDIEGRSLQSLAAVGIVPVPEVLHSAPDLLVMEFVEVDGLLSASAELHAADLLAALHNVSAPSYGYEYDTVIGGLPQPNGTMSSWPRFFAERRLVHMAGLARDVGRLPASLFERVARFSEQLERWLPSPNKPGLVHGDIWAGNVLVRGGRIAAFIDPAIYYADPEVELAFITLFSTFNERFFSRYQEHRPIASDFFEQRKDVYNLYPLLVHSRLFGGGYVGQVKRILDRFGA